MKKAIYLSAFVVASTLAACGGSDSTPPPLISTQPAATSAFAGGSATLTVQATGSGLTYQWLRDGAPIGGAVDASYTLTSVSAADQGASYTVVVANSGGSVTSNPAVLSVVPADRAARRLLVRLAVSMQALTEIAGMGIVVFGPDAGLSYFDPASCGTGSATGTLDGATVQPGAGFAAGKHTLQATFNDCEWDAASFFGGGWAATIDAPTLPADTTGWTVDAQFAAARTRYLGSDASIGNYDDQATGSLRLTARIAPVGANQVDETYLIAPAAGLAFTNNRLGTGGATATLRSGTYLARERYDPVSPDFDGETEVRHDALRFDVDGVPYLAQGNCLQKYDKDGNIVDYGGEMVVTSNGLRVGRIFGTNTPAPGFYYEVDGQIVPLAAAALGVAPAAARAGGSATAAARRVRPPARATVANGELAG